MKSIILILSISLCIFGCSPSKQKHKTLKRIEVASVTIVDPSAQGVTKEYKRQSPYGGQTGRRIFIELDENWLKVTTVLKFNNGKKETHIDHYLPETLLKYSTGDWY